MSAESRPTESATVEGDTLTIIRIFDATREQVFQAWIDPDQLAQWWGPEQLHTPRESIEIDPRVGGIWKATMVMNAGGQEYPTRAEIIRIKVPELIEMRETASEMFPFETILKISLEEFDGKTILTIISRMITENPDFGGAVEGWGTSLEKLRRLLSV